MATVTVDTERDYSEFSLDDRLDACANVQEGTELGDAITACVNAGYRLNSINEQELSMALCVIAERLCEDVFEYGGQAAFEDNSPEIIKYFTGIDYKHETSNVDKKILKIVQSLNQKEVIALKALMEKY